MSTLLEKAMERVVALPQDEQDAIASQILASLADEDAWKSSFVEKRDVIRRMAQEALEEDNPAHPGLQFKKLEGEDNVYSARIGLEYRALAVMKKDRIVWYWIGGHSEYDRLV
jgi:hypothetical protein